MRRGIHENVLGDISEKKNHKKSLVKVQGRISGTIFRAIQRRIPGGMSERIKKGNSGIFLKKILVKFREKFLEVLRQKFSNNSGINP